MTPMADDLSKPCD